MCPKIRHGRFTVVTPEPNPFDDGHYPEPSTITTDSRIGADSNYFKKYEKAYRRKDVETVQELIDQAHFNDPLLSETLKASVLKECRRLRNEDGQSRFWTF